MKVKAKHWLNYNGIWHMGGEEFEIPTTDADVLGDMVEIAETPVQIEPEASAEEQPKRRGRQKRAEKSAEAD